MSDNLTPKRDDVFIEELRKRGNVSAACRIADISRQTAYDWRNSFPIFKQRWDDACIEAKERLEEEAFRRAHDGVQSHRKTFDLKGNVTSEEIITKYSDTLMIFLLKSLDRDKYQDRIDVLRQVEIRTQDELGKFLDKLRIADPEAYERVMKVASEGASE